MNETLDVCGQEPRIVRGEEVHHDEPFRQAAGQRQDGVHVVVCRAGSQLGLGQADRHLLEVRRHDQSARAGEDAQAAFVDELRANIRHVGKQRGLVERFRG